MSNDEIFFSVIIPTFNREKSLDRAINSVLKQTFKKWELIVVDNFSNDNTINLINSLSQIKFLFIKLIIMVLLQDQEILGLVSHLASMFVFLDSDDCGIQIN